MEDKKYNKNKIFARVTLSLVVIFIICILLVAGRHEDKPEKVVSVEKTPEVNISRDDLVHVTPGLIEERYLTIDWNLQEYIAETVQRYKVGFATVVVMDAHTGEILAFYGKDHSGENCSRCLDTYLAASLFKVITATAAMDIGGMNPDTVFSYNGKAHTLYKTQLTTRRNKWTRDISLKKAFAHSNNVVFGKIGYQYLGEEPLFLTAMKLGFWTSPLDECDCEPSTLFIPETDYNVAELASGFNRYTRISPVHAAQIASSVMNEGEMVMPRLTGVTREDPVPVMSEKSADYLRSMMAGTVRRGTVSGTFNGYRRDRVLKNLEIGAKSGSINGTDPDGRRNWFVGYAKEKNDARAITIACLVIRDDYFWIEADGLARKVIRQYFSEPITLAGKE